MSLLSSWVYHFVQLPALSVMPLHMGEWVANQLARKLFHQDDRRSQATVEAIETVFGQSKEQREIVEIAQKSFETRVWEDVSAYRFPFWRSANINSLFEFHGMRHLEEARRKGKGGLLIGVHFGLLCGGLVAVNLKGFPVNYLANDTPDDPAFDSALQRHSRLKIHGMEKKGGKFISFDLRRDRSSSSLATAETLNRLRHNEFVAALMDIDPGSFSNTEDADFMGCTVRFPTGFLRLAYLAGTPVIPHFTLRDNATGRYRVLIEEPIGLSGDLKKDLQASVDRISKRILENPCHWMAWDGLLGALRNDRSE